MFIILGKKEYNKLREEIDTLRHDKEYWKQKYEELNKKRKTQELAHATIVSNLKEEMKKRDYEWYVKWCDEVQKRAATTQLLRNEMDRRLGLDDEEDDDDEEGESA